MSKHKKNNNVLEICELIDLIGAIKYYAKEKFNLSLDDLIVFSEATENAFKNGDAPARLKTSRLHTAGFRIHLNPVL